MNLVACGNLPIMPVTGIWYRAINARYSQTPLAYQHTRTISGRFNPGSYQRPSFPVVYLAEDQQVAMFEVSALLGSPLPGQAFQPNPASPSWLIIPVQVTLGTVVDLCTPSTRKAVRTSVQELTGDWRAYVLRNPSPALSAPYWSVIPTQRLGAALHGVAGIQGFLSYSARVPTKRILCIFPAQLPKNGASVQYTDPHGVIHSIP